MNVQRLEALERELRRRNPTLYMGNWAECACGWAAREMPEFQILGFRWEKFQLSTGLHHFIAFGEIRPIAHVVKDFFDLTQLQMEHLFCISNSRESMQTGIEVADRIRRLLDLNANGTMTVTIDRAALERIFA